jgi:murein DD-endopeptidase MepM/ murein hydrolase activator NlpD
LKRTIPQKVTPVSHSIAESGEVVEPSKQANSETNRRARTSAAVIGLAISMGAQSLLIVHQTDDAIAAEPSGESTVATAAPVNGVVDEATASAPSLSPLGNRVVEHVVQEGQTIWQLANLYGVSAGTIAITNNLPLASVLHVGQVLKVPLSSPSNSGSVPALGRGESPSYYGLVADNSTLEQSVTLKAKQDAALDQMQHKREELRAGLSKLKSANQEAPSTRDKASESSLAAAVTPAITHRVAAGDTLSAIAKTYGVSLGALAKANRISNPNFIHVNQVLTVPNATAFAPVARTAAHKNSQLVAMAPKVATSGVPVITSDTQPDGVLAPVAGVLPSPVADQASTGDQAPHPAATVQFQGRLASLPTQPEPATPADSVQKPEAAAASADTQVATAPFAVAPLSQSDDSANQMRRDYVENLRQDIVKLREKYKNSPEVAPLVSLTDSKIAAIVPMVPPRAEALSSGDRVNPEMSSANYADSLRYQVRKLRNRVQTNQTAAATPAGSLAPVSTRSSSTLVATAPLGSQTYEPLVPSSLGQMVSPDLPPLGGVENYLPGNSGKFNGYIWPAKGLLTSGYGWRWGRMHKGIDVAAPIGTPVVAAAPGVVISAGWNSGGYGNLVEIQHADGSVTLYAHNNRILVREGQSVEQGQQIAEMGSTGYSTGPHCHFEVHLPGHGAVNPIAYLPRAGA